MKLLFEYTPGMGVAALGGTFTRATSATYTDRNGVVKTAAAGILRDAHYINGLRHTLLEKAAQNLLIRSQEFDNAAWTKSASGAATAPAVTANEAVAPDLTVTAEKVVFIAPGAGDHSQLQSTPMVTVIGTKYTGSLWVQAYSAADVGKTILLRHAGANAYLAIVLTSAWQRVAVTETAVAVATTYELALRPSLGSSSGTVTVRLWGGQFELGSYATSYVATAAAAVTRNADALHFDTTMGPQSMTAYAAFTEMGTILEGGGARILQIGNLADAVPQLVLYNQGAAYSLYHHDGLGAVNSTQAAAPTQLQGVELRGVLSSTGAVTCGQSIGGAAETVAATSAALAPAAAWSAPTKIMVGGLPVGPAAVALRVLRIDSGERTMAEMRPPRTYLRFEDSAGIVFLGNEEPFPGNRFSNWTTLPDPAGAAHHRQSDSQRTMFRVRDDQCAHLELHKIPSKLIDGVVPSDLAARLVYHLKNGGNVLVATGDVESASYAKCGMRDGSEPRLTLSEKRTIEYSLSLDVVNLEAVPAMMVCRYADQ